MVRSIYADRERLEVFDSLGKRYAPPMEWDCLAACHKDGYAGLVMLALREYFERNIAG